MSTPAGSSMRCEPSMVFAVPVDEADQAPGRASRSARGVLSMRATDDREPVLVGGQRMGPRTGGVGTGSIVSTICGADWSMIRGRTLFEADAMPCSHVVRQLTS
ncbi:MAG: hypothetical protein R2694_19270 [Ilumatobacteraceae bacterium]